MKTIDKYFLCISIQTIQNKISESRSQQFTKGCFNIKKPINAIYYMIIFVDATMTINKT